MQILPDGPPGVTLKSAVQVFGPEGLFIVTIIAVIIVVFEDHEGDFVYVG